MRHQVTNVTADTQNSPHLAEQAFQLPQHVYTDRRRNRGNKSTDFGCTIMLYRVDEFNELLSKFRGCIVSELNLVLVL